MSIEQRANELYDNGIRKVKVTWMNGYKETLRLFKHPSAGLCHYKRRSSRRGYPLPFNNIESIEPIAAKKRKTEEQRWRDAWLKVRARLVASGLWEDRIPEIDAALALGYKTIVEANRTYWDIPHGDGRDKAVQEFAEKYPTLVKTNDEGKLYINTSILWPHNSLPKVKKMRFDRGSYNDAYLTRIKAAMEAGKKHHESGTHGYDISFEYNPEKKVAWYSEEYRNTRNGHYYIALDSTHALFVEDD